MTLQEFALFARTHLPKGFTLIKVYQAFEGDFRAIAIDGKCIQHRFVLDPTSDDLQLIEKP